MKHRSKAKKRIGFFIMPVIYMLLGYLLIYLIMLPVSTPISAVLDMAFLNKPPIFSTGFQSIYSKSQSESQGETIRASEVEFPSYGTHYGNITVERIGLDVPLLMGDSDKELKNGAGQFFGSFVPGYGKTTLIAGHNHTFFKPIQNLQVGDEIRIDTSYGHYVYEVTDLQVRKYNDATAYDLAAEHENLVLYTCYPFNSWGFTPERYFVYAKPVSGPKIIQGS